MTVRCLIRYTKYHLIRRAGKVFTARQRFLTTTLHIRTFPWYLTIAIITYLSISAEDYCRNFVDLLAVQLRVTFCPNPHCPSKGMSLLTLHQVRERAAWETSERDGKSDQRVLVARLRCSSCGTTHTLLPDFLCPFVVTRPLFSMVC